MRRLLLILLAALLPLQWSGAAIAALCVVQDAEHVHAMAWSPIDEHSAAHAVGHHGHDVVAQALPVAQPAHEAGAAAHHDGHAAHPHDPAIHADAGATDGDGATMSHHGACCHAGAVALPAAGAIVHPPPSARATAPSPAMPALSHASDGPFRPPRTVTA